MPHARALVERQRRKEWGEALLSFLRWNVYTHFLATATVKVYLFCCFSSACRSKVFFPWGRWERHKIYCFEIQLYAWFYAVFSGGACMKMFRDYSFPVTRILDKNPSSVRLFSRLKIRKFNPKLKLNVNFQWHKNDEKMYTKNFHTMNDWNVSVDGFPRCNPIPTDTTSLNKK